MHFWNFPENKTKQRQNLIRVESLYWSLAKFIFQSEESRGALRFGFNFSNSTGEVLARRIFNFQSCFRWTSEQNLLHIDTEHQSVTAT